MKTINNFKSQYGFYPLLNWLLLFLPFLNYAQNPYMVTDLNILPGNTYSGSPQTVTTVNGISYFSANNGVHGYELWRTNGTSSGTYMVKDIRTGFLGSGTFVTAKYGNQILMGAEDGINGIELWISDGTTTGTLLLKDIYPGGSSAPNNFVELNGIAYFTATTLTHGYELWRTDGSSAGTYMVKDIWAGSNNSTINQIVIYNNALYFVANDGINGIELWTSDGTSAGTILVKDINPGINSSSPSELLVAGGKIYFAADNGILGKELWSSDGSPGGTQIVQDIRTGVSSSSPSTFCESNGHLFYKANDGLTGEELWKTNLSTSVTQLVKDINPGAGNSAPATLVNLNGTVIFRAFDGAQGPEVWKSDGTTAGTVLLKDIRAGSPSSSYAILFTVVNSLVFFRADDGVNGTELWKTDGTTAGTVMVKDIWPGITGNNALAFKNINGELYFQANDGIFGAELWKSDGTSGGTQMIKDISTGSGPSSPANLTYGNGEIFFSATNGANGNELWKSDGTLTGTVMVKDIKPGSFGSFLNGNQGQFTFLDGILFFRTDDGTSGLELWRSDGSEVGTYLLKDINPGPAGSNPFGFIKLNGTYYFLASNGTNGFELWKTDGTGAGTSLVIDINPGTGSSINSLMTLFNGELYFFATNGTSGIEFWKTNGTAVGTVLVKDINPGINGSYPPTGTNITLHNGKLYFHADDGVNGAELWVSDGTPGGTQMLNDINTGSAGSDPNTASFLSIGTNLYFIANTSTHGTELWLTDGTSGGTQLVKDIKPGTSSSGPGTFIEFQGALYFAADDGINGRELWKSDRTANGTFLIKDIYPGPLSGTGNLFVVDNKIYLQGADATNGLELWISDGTTGGTSLKKDIVLGSNGSVISNFINASGKLYFTASYVDENQFQYGSELWSMGYCNKSNDIGVYSGKRQYFNNELQTTPATAFCFCDVFNNLFVTVDAIGTNPVSGPISVTQWIDPTNTSKFADRFYAINPEISPENSTARISLYFTQDDFDDYNASVPQHLIFLPVDSTDHENKANVYFEKREGVSNDGSGFPWSYSSSPTLVNPDDGDIIFNHPENRWEISFNVTSFSGFFLKIYPCPILNSAPSNVSVVNSSCNNCVVSGGTISAPPGNPCPLGSSLQYQVNGGSWSLTLPTYAQNGPAQSIKTRCACNENPDYFSAESATLTTVPGSCPPCPPPAQVFHSNVTPNSALVLWQSGGSSCITKYQLKIRYALGNGGWSNWSSWINKSSSVYNHLYTGLSPNTLYHYMIRSKCGSLSNSSVISDWFTTPPSFSSDVENTSAEQQRTIEVYKSTQVLESNQELDITAGSYLSEVGLRVLVSSQYSDKCDLVIYDMLGKQICDLKGAQCNDWIKLDFGNLVTGYYVIIASDGRDCKTLKFPVSSERE